MHKLILVKHSMPRIIPGIPAREWQLSEQGRDRCDLLGERLKMYAPYHLVASPEPKASLDGGAGRR